MLTLSAKARDYARRELRELLDHSYPPPPAVAHHRIARALYRRAATEARDLDEFLAYLEAADSALAFAHDCALQRPWEFDPFAGF